jgi:muramidase (phage lysozyme)
MCRISIAAAGGPNVCAFLDMLAVAEIGARLLAVSDDGYDVIVGSTYEHPRLMRSYADHPRQLISLPKWGVKSTAAGRYQIIAPTWDGLLPTLAGPGAPVRALPFSPENQDRACIQLLRECRAYAQIVGGNIEGAIALARKTWASLPGAGYGQPEHSLSDLLGVFQTRLGKYRADFTNVQAGVETTAPTS